MKRHLCRTSMIAALCLLAAAFSGHAQGPKKDPNEAKTPNYYPMQVGNEWRFKVTVGSNEAITISRIAKIETIDGIALARLEATVNGKLVANEHLRQSDRGVFRHRNNGQEATPAICLLRYPVKFGSKWGGEVTVGDDKGSYICEAKEETVEVPAGKFKTVRVDVKFEGQQTVNTTYWFCQDVGFVKQTVETGNLNIVMELEKYELKKAAPK